MKTSRGSMTELAWRQHQERVGRPVGQLNLTEDVAPEVLERPHYSTDVKPTQTESGRAFNVVLPWPPTLNSNTERVTMRRADGSSYMGYALTDEHRQFRREVQRCVVFGKIRKISGPCEVLIAAFPPNNLRADIDNLVKPILDALKPKKRNGCVIWAGVIDDDFYVEKVTIERVRQHPYTGGAVNVTIAKLGL